MGYAGGTKRNPTYQSLGDHTETVQVDYDPSRITYEQLLAVFWDSHSPTHRPSSRQYMSIIFYHNDEQRRLAEASKARGYREPASGRAKRKAHLYTEIRPFTAFTLAEDYHQKYYLRGARELAREFAAIYPKEADFVASTAAARVNGYLGGNGTPEALKAQIDSFGLSPARRKALLERAGHPTGPGCSLP